MLSSLLSTYLMFSATLFTLASSENTKIIKLDALTENKMLPNIRICLNTEWEIYQKPKYSSPPSTLVNSSLTFL